MRVSKAVVTGGAGFIGSHITEELLKHDIETIVVDNLCVGKREYIPKGAGFVEADIMDAKKLEKVFSHADVVFHEAAFVSIRNSIDNFYNDADANITGTMNVIKAVIKKKVKKLIYASSMAVYGEAEELPIKETHRLEPISPYGISKLTGEKYCLQMARHHDFEAVSLRYFNAFGTRQVLSPYVGVITIFINSILDNKAPLIFGNGRQIRDFVSVLDIANANILAMERGKNGQIMNIGTGKGTSVNEIAKMLLDKLSSSLVPEYRPFQAGEPRNSIADISRAERCIGYKPRYRFMDKMDEIIEWNRGNR